MASQHGQGWSALDGESCFSLLPRLRFGSVARGNGVCLRPKDFGENRLMRFSADNSCRSNNIGIGGPSSTRPTSSPERKNGGDSRSSSLRAAGL